MMSLQVLILLDNMHRDFFTAIAELVDNAIQAVKANDPQERKIQIRLQKQKDGTFGVTVIHLRRLTDE
jgi:HSP90 family molecular chaperone